MLDPCPFALHCCLCPTDSDILVSLDCHILTSLLRHYCRAWPASPAFQTLIYSDTIITLAHWYVNVDFPVTVNLEDSVAHVDVIHPERLGHPVKVSLIHLLTLRPGVALWFIQGREIEFQQNTLKLIQKTALATYAPAFAANRRLPCSSILTWLLSVDDSSGTQLTQTVLLENIQCLNGMKR